MDENKKPSLWDALKSGDISAGIEVKLNNTTMINLGITLVVSFSIIILLYSVTKKI